MASRFEREGVSFQYPGTWRLEREEVEGGWSVVRCKVRGRRFLTLTFDEGMPEVEEMADAALAALREVYPDLEADDRVEPFAGQMAVGHDITFISLDLTNTLLDGSFYSDTGTLLLLCQLISDFDLEYTARCCGRCARRCAWRSESGRALLPN